MQNKFTFSKYFRNSYPKDYRPSGYLSVEDEFKSKLLKQGYLIKDLKIENTITITCFGAKANIPYEERIKLQETLL